MAPGLAVAGSSRRLGSGLGGQKLPEGRSGLGSSPEHRSKPATAQSHFESLLLSWQLTSHRIRRSTWLDQSKCVVGSGGAEGGWAVGGGAGGGDSCCEELDLIQSATPEGAFPGSRGMCLLSQGCFSVRHLCCHQGSSCEHLRQVTFCALMPHFALALPFCFWRFICF